MQGKPLPQREPVQEAPGPEPGLCVIRGLFNCNPFHLFRVGGKKYPSFPSEKRGS